MSVTNDCIIGVIFVTFFTVCYMELLVYENHIICCIAVHNKLFYFYILYINGVLFMSMFKEQKFLHVHYMFYDVWKTHPGEKFVH